MSCEVRALVPTTVSTRRIVRLINSSLRTLRRSRSNVSVALVDDRRMRELNAQYRRRRETTDVLSFPGVRPELGEIIISIPQAKRQATAVHHSLQTEVEILLIHGLLHLLGYDHHRPDERRRMERRERSLLAGRSLITRAHR